MSADQFTEVSHQSWFSRIGNAFSGILIGLVLIIIAFVLLFWNEGRSVKRYKTLKEGAGIVMSIPSDSVDPGNEGKLVHLSGLAQTTDTPSDPLFGVSTKALKLRRSAEMYQWTESSHTEEKKKLGGGTEKVTTYTYDKEWHGSLVDSGSFKVKEGHNNPAQMPVGSDTFDANPVTLGAFTLTPSILSSIGGSEAVQLQKENTRIPSFWSGTTHIENQTIYMGETPNSPKVGDIRVTFTSVPEQEISIVAKQTLRTFSPYVTEAGGSIELVESGVVDAVSMFASAQAGNRLLTWLIRLGGFLVMLIAWNLLFKPLSVLADVVPLFGNIVGIGTGFVAFIIAATLSLVTIAVAWIVYRPVIGISLLVVAIILIYILMQKAGKRKTA